MNRAWLLLALLALPASAQRPAEVVVVGPEGETVLTGEWVGAELGEPVRVLIDQTKVFANGFE